MKILTVAVSVLCVLALAAGPAFGQEEGRCDCKEISKAHFKKDHGKKDAPPKKGEGGQDAPKKKDGPQEGGDVKKGPPKEGGGDRKCGKNAAGIYEEWAKRQDVNAKDLEKNIKDHFQQHPDNVCHCLCGHNEGGFKKEGGGDAPPPIKKVPGDAPPPVKKEGPPGDVRPKVKKCVCEHAHDGDCKKEGGDAPPPVKKEGGGDGGPPKKIGVPGDGGKPKQKCTCDHKHEGECKDKEKGNNGVGNGQDPQPPGKPPVNDGPGADKGKPGNKGGDKK